MTLTTLSSVTKVTITNDYVSKIRNESRLNPISFGNSTFKGIFMLTTTS